MELKELEGTYKIPVTTSLGKVNVISIKNPLYCVESKEFYFSTKQIIDGIIQIKNQFETEPKDLEVGYYNSEVK